MPASARNARFHDTKQARRFLGAELLGILNATLADATNFFFSLGRQRPERGEQIFLGLRHAAIISRRRFILIRACSFLFVAPPLTEFEVPRRDI